MVPLAFITGYSLIKYEQAIDQELSQRLKGNAREISVMLGEFESTLFRENENHRSDRTLRRRQAARARRGQPTNHPWARNLRPTGFVGGAPVGQPLRSSLPEHSRTLSALQQRAAPPPRLDLLCDWREHCR